jgi:hypothetical protein
MTAKSTKVKNLINILWGGPHCLDVIRRFDNRDSDYGLYQIYAHHPVYGFGLVYIGRAREQTFATRVSQHDWGSGSENDPRQVEAYVGRLIGETPDLDTWRGQIDAAEKLLIHSHAPAYNTQHIYNSPLVSECEHIRVLNWGACRSLAREVSGLMWTSAGVELRSKGVYQTTQLLRRETASLNAGSHLREPA